ncbi:MAG: TlpA family protein disulfide reductase [Actinomycetota bacterium]
MRRRLILIIVLIAAVGSAATIAFTASDPPGTVSDKTGSSKKSAGRSLGSVAGLSFDGFGRSEKVELDAMRGKPLVLNYWASWCPFCISEMPDFQNVYERVSDRVEFLGVNIQDDVGEAKHLARVTGVRYPLAVDPDGDVYRRLRGFSMPTTWFIDAKGRIVERFSGPLDAEQLADRITEHFGS